MTPSTLQTSSNRKLPSITLLALLMPLMMTLSGCAAIEGIFKAGFVVGIIVVIVIVGLIALVASMFRK